MTPLKRFKNLILIDKQDIYQIFLYSIIAGLISLSLPLGIQSIINFIQAGKVSTSWIILVVIVVVGVAFVGLLKIMQFRITENLQQKIFVRSSFEFAYRFPKIKFNELHNQYPPELANRFFDTLTVQKGFSKLLLDISGAALQIIFGIILLSLYHSFFIFFGLVLLILLYLIFKINFNVGLETSLKESKYKYKIAHWLQEIARNHLSFKSNSIFNFSLHKNDKLVNEYLKQRESHFQVLMKQFIQLTGFKILITAGLLIIGGLLVIGQQMNIGQFVAAEIIILTIITAVEKLFGGLELFYDVLTSLEKLGGVVDLEIENSERDKKFDLEDDLINLELRSISYKYPNSENYVLKNIDLDLKQGDKIILRGRNGSGKTTLVRIIAKILEPTSGNLFINEMQAKKVLNEDYQSKIGHLAFNTSAFEGTILENLTFNNTEISKNEINKVLEIVKLNEYLKTLPNGLETMLYTDGKQINSSVVQKIVLARILLMQPKVILLEDPLSKIEPEQAKEIFHYLMDEENPWTLLFISNQIDLEMKNVKIIELEKDEKGRVLSAKYTGDGQEVVVGGQEKMSKSKNNGIDPQSIIDQYGADTARVFMMFAAPPDQSLEWSDAGVEGANRFLKRVWRLATGFLEKGNQATAIDTANLSKDAQDLRRKTHETTQKVGDDIERRHAFNTSIAALMELLNATNKFEAKDDNDAAVAREAITTLLTLLAPFAPHLSQTLLAQFSIDINTTLFPQVDESALTRNTQTIVVQVNGKLRGKLDVAVDISKDELLALAKALPEVQQFLTGPTKKEIVVPNKLVNLVV